MSNGVRIMSGDQFLTPVMTIFINVTILNIRTDGRADGRAGGRSDGRAGGLSGGRTVWRVDGRSGGSDPLMLIPWFPREKNGQTTRRKDSPHEWFLEFF